MPEFSKFSHLPQELQDLIWTFALPGPRTLIIKFQDFRSLFAYGPENVTGLQRTVAGVEGSISIDRTGQLVEIGHNQAPKSALPWTCRSARLIASKGYETCFSWVKSSQTKLNQLMFDEATNRRWLEPVDPESYDFIQDDDFVSEGIRFRPEFDTIYLGGYSDLAYLDENTSHNLRLGNIKKLAICSELMFSHHFASCLGINHVLGRPLSRHPEPNEYSITGTPWFAKLEELILVDYEHNHQTEAGREKANKEWVIAIKKDAAVPKDLKITFRTAQSFLREATTWA